MQFEAQEERHDAYEQEGSPENEEQMAEESTLIEGEDEEYEKNFEDTVHQVADIPDRVPPKVVETPNVEDNSNPAISDELTSSGTTSEDSTRATETALIAHCSPPQWLLTPILAAASVSAVAVSTMCPALTAVLLYSSIVYAKWSLRG